MIIRKPYAFLIKNFKKVHIAMLVLAIFIYFKSTQVYSYVREFISLGSYDVTNDPISKYINIFVIIAVLALIIGSALLIILLKRKEKPWKLYLIPLVQYILFFLGFMIIRNFFNAYTGIESSSSLRLWRDILLISHLSQFGIVIIFAMRILGVDLNKFNFKLDDEYLDLEAKDREELEISISIDKNSFKRTYKKTLRVLNYFYQEHKLLCRAAVVIIAIIVARNTFVYIANHKSYKQGDTFSVNGYTVKINNSYFTDKSYNGTVISKNSDFVIVNLTIKNDYSRRKPNLNRYHIINGIENYTTTVNTYGTEFKDLGKTYESITLNRDESVTMILVFKVDKNLRKDRFVLYYQELNGEKEYLRKIKLNIKDLSKIETQEELSMGDTMDFKLGDKEEDITFEESSITEQVEYTYNYCSGSNCYRTKDTYKAESGTKVLRLKFGSSTYEGQDVTTLATNYGKIVYKTPTGKDKEIEVKSAIRRQFFGKYLYVIIPDAAASSNSINFVFTIRNKKYIYKIV